MLLSPDNGLFVFSRGFAFTVWDAGEKSNKAIYLVTGRRWVEDVNEAVLGQPLGFDQVTQVKPKQIELYPNPLKDKLFWKSSATILRMELSDVLGNVFGIWKGNIENPLSIGHLPKGMYYLAIRFSSQGSITQKLVIDGRED